MASLATARLLLRPFDEADLEPFAALNAHPLVVPSPSTALSVDSPLRRHVLYRPRPPASPGALSLPGPRVEA